MRSAAQDERIHAVLCAELAFAYGATTIPEAQDVPIAPRNLDPRAAVLYEVVASCCITETESVATLATLLGQDLEPGVDKALREIARDEVAHGRMGWAHLAREAARADVSFLSPVIPAMLSGSVDDALFARADTATEDPELLRHGVLPHSRKRSVFVRALQDVIFPGLEQLGISSGPARAWLAAREA
jgi:hypothetical protein